MTNETEKAGALTVNTLANEIRRVDGSHTLGASALAEAIMAFLRASLHAPVEGLPAGCPEIMTWDPYWGLMQVGQISNAAPIELHPLGTAARIADLQLNSQAESWRADAAEERESALFRPACRTRKQGEGIMAESIARVENRLKRWEERLEEVRKWPNNFPIFAETNAENAVKYNRDLLEKMKAEAP